MTRNTPLDAMTEFAMEALLAADADRQTSLVCQMAERWPDQPALSLSYALAAGTGAIAHHFGQAAARDPAVLQGYRLSALVAADVHALNAMGLIAAEAEDLLHFWRRTAPANPCSQVHSVIR